MKIEDHSGKSYIIHISVKKPLELYQIVELLADHFDIETYGSFESFDGTLLIKGRKHNA